MNLRVVPIQSWPQELTRNRKRHPFRKMNSGGWMDHRVDWSSTVELLERELRMLRGKDVLLQMAVTDRDIRNDGWIRANARASHPGVILSFDSKHGPLSYPCDAFSDWQANVRTLALALEALRKVDRYGVTKRGEQYTGWKQLPAQSSADPYSVLAAHAGMTEESVRQNPRRAFRKAAMETHPDRGGDATAFSEVKSAAQLIGVN